MWHRFAVLHHSYYASAAIVRDGKGERERYTNTLAVPGINSIFTSLKMFNILSLVLGHTQKSVRWMPSNPN